VHYPVAPLMTSNNAESLLIAALGGMGIVLFPDWLIGDRLKRGADRPYAGNDVRHQHGATQYCGDLS
jgi:DNA-binding transcriptional LysR family regulator